MKKGLGVISALLILAAISSVSYANDAGQNDVAYLPVRAIPNALSPSELKVDTASYVFRQIAEGLFGIGEGFQIYTNIADRFSWSADGKMLTIHLRKVNFSDGTPVQVSDVVRSLNYCVKNAGKTLLVGVRSIEGYGTFIQNKKSALSGIKIKSETELTVSLSKRSPLLLDDFAQADCHIVKPNSSGSFDLLKGALGSGPYFLKSVSPSEITIEQTPNYRGKHSGPKIAVYRATKDYGDFEKLKILGDDGCIN